MQIKRFVSKKWSGEVRARVTYTHPDIHEVSNTRPNIPALVLRKKSYHLY